MPGVIAAYLLQCSMNKGMSKAWLRTQTFQQVFASLPGIRVAIQGLIEDLDNLI